MINQKSFKCALLNINMKNRWKFVIGLAFVIFFWGIKFLSGELGNFFSILSVFLMWFISSICFLISIKYAEKKLERATFSYLKLIGLNFVLWILSTLSIFLVFFLAGRIYPLGADLGAEGGAFLVMYVLIFGPMITAGLITLFSILPSLIFIYVQKKTKEKREELNESFPYLLFGAVAGLFGFLWIFAATLLFTNFVFPLLLGTFLGWLIYKYRLTKKIEYSLICILAGSLFFIPCTSMLNSILKSGSVNINTRGTLLLIYFGFVIVFGVIGLIIGLIADLRKR